MQKKSFASSLLLAGLPLLFFTACGNDNESRLPKRYPVSGIVTLDDKPLEKGSIKFISASDAELGIQASANIIDGRYELVATPGAKTVQINHIAETRKNNFENLIPPKYNSGSTLEKEITTEANNFDFELTTD